MDEFFSHPAEQTYVTNKTDFYFIGDTWSMDFLDLMEIGPNT